jgi:hypothetical protein
MLRRVSLVGSISIRCARVGVPRKNEYFSVTFYWERLTGE